jgi:hypothetical protein
MRNNALLKRAAAAAVLAATVVTPVVAGLTAGTANAVPREINCRGMAQAHQSSTHVAEGAVAQGDYYAAYQHFSDAAAAKQNYDRYCLGNG